MKVYILVEVFDSDDCITTANVIGVWDNEQAAEKEKTLRETQKPRYNVFYLFKQELMT